MVPTPLCKSSQAVDHDTKLKRNEDVQSVPSQQADNHPSCASLEKCISSWPQKWEKDLPKVCQHLSSFFKPGASGPLTAKPFTYVNQSPSCSSLFFILASSFFRRASQLSSSSLSLEFCAVVEAVEVCSVVPVVLVPP